MLIAIIGAGYVGLVTGACLAKVGHNVVVTDSNADRIADLKAGKMPIFEPGLDAMVRDAAASHNLHFTRDTGLALMQSDVVFIAVGTPQGSDGHADLGAIRSVARDIGIALCERAGHVVVVNKSTVPVGTTELVRALIERQRPIATFEVASNPEFLREGQAIPDFMRPDRVVIGTPSASAAATLRQIYAPITDRIIDVDCRTAELIKYAANAYLAMKITFINEMADLCEEVGADIEGVSRGIGSDRRIGPDFLRPGPGYGGSCFPKDTMALSTTARNAGSPLSLVDATIAVNDARKRAMGRRVVDALDGDVADRTIAVLGLTFKAGTDDMRDSPSIDIIDVLQEHGAQVTAYDPKGMENASVLLEGVEFNRTPYRAAAAASAVVIATDWPEFRSLDLDALARTMKRNPVMIDLRNCIDPVAARASGFVYRGIGR